MRIAQIILPGATAYERKSQRIDAAALAERHQVFESTIESFASARADLAHVYAGAGDLPAASFVGFPFPYVASSDVHTSRWSWRRPVRPSVVVSPLTAEPLPEAVEERYFAAADVRASGGERRTIGSFNRPSARNLVEQTLARIHRFRTDVDWRVFEEEPAPEDLAGVDAWVDPATDETDFDGFTAEALAVGLPVVAARTPINVLRLEQGRTGFLVPPRDPNEMTHAILSALFKTEVAQAKQSAARQTVSKFRARQRLRILTRIYETVKTADDSNR
jgi:hypothetical protein